MDAQKMLLFPPVLDLPAEVQLWMEQLRGYLSSDISPMLQGRMAEETELPTASEEHRGRVLFVKGEGVVADKLYLCRWDGAAYGWVQVG